VAWPAPTATATLKVISPTAVPTSGWARLVGCVTKKPARPAAPTVAVPARRSGRLMKKGSDMIGAMYSDPNHGWSSEPSAPREAAMRKFIPAPQSVPRRTWWRRRRSQRSQVK
jgi:hypothetical protein